MNKATVTQLIKATFTKENRSERIENSIPAFKQTNSDTSISGLAFELKLGERQPWLAQIVTSAMDAIISVDAEQRIVFFNAAAEQMYGYAAAEVLGQPLARLIPTRLHIKHNEHIHHFSETGKPTRVLGRLGEIIGLRRSGEEFPVEASISQIEIDGQKIFTVILRDLSERLQAEAALRESEERFRLMIDTAPVMGWLAGTDARRNFFNRTWLDFTGHTLEQELSNDWAEGVHPEDYQRCSDTYRTAFAARESYSIEYRRRRADGEYRWLLSKGDPLFTPAGFAGYIGISIDITKRKQAEIALEQSNEDLQHTNEVLTNISEELTCRKEELEEKACELVNKKDELQAVNEALATYVVELDQTNNDLQNLITSTQIGTIFLDRALHIKRYTPQVRGLFNLLPSDIGRPIEHLVPHFDYKDLQADAERVLDKLTVIERETRSAAGAWYLVRLLPYRTQQDKIDGVVVTFIEISERKRMEEELRQVLLEIRQLKDQLQDENVYLQEELRSEYDFEQIIGHSNSLKKALHQVKQVAPADSTVLITGETGTGKELVARAIHSISKRRNRPLVRVNCAALPASLVESELFGHERGAFTGASAKRTGRFELAHGGTIFLDEVGELPLELQAKLLRVLQEGEFERLGSSRTIKVDVRVLAATNQNLEESVQTGKFRADLYYRLNVFPIRLPPLRERFEDIRLLVNFYVNQFSQKLGKRIEAIPAAAMEEMVRYPWPGNVRELKNVIERAVILSTDGKLRLAESLQINEVPQIKPVVADEQAAEPEAMAVVRLDDVERNHIMQVMEQTFWRVEGENGAAAILGLNPGTLRSRLKKLGLRRPRG